VPDDTDPPGGDLTDRVERLETGQTSILAKLDQLLAGAHGKAEKHEEQVLGRPSSVEEQVRMELERRDKEAADKAAADKDKAERESIAERLAKLTEAKPQPPQPRRQRAMWGKR
jgi:hypothetical protein